MIITKLNMKAGLYIQYQLIDRTKNFNINRTLRNVKVYFKFFGNNIEFFF